MAPRVDFFTAALMSSAHAAASRAVRATADAAADRARQLAHVDTGAYKASIYVATADDSTYAASVAAAAALNPTAGFDAEMSVPASATRTAAVAAPAVDYGLELEVGSKGHAGYATMGTAAATMQQELETALSAELRGGGW